jgi:hypothetical protein
MPFRRGSREDSGQDPVRKRRPIRVDPGATSTSGDAPAFIARPAGSPVYYGFPIIESSEVEGFRFGMITDYVADADTCGDAFVVAPDDSRAGLVWESEVTVPYFSEVLPPTQDRWGVWGVGTGLPMRTEDDAHVLLRSLLPELRPRWEKWKRQP